MPELPEVETVRRSLMLQVRGREIAAVWVGAKRLRIPWQRRWTRELAGQRIATLRRRAKWLLFDLDSGQSLVAHLGMTGRLIVLPRTAPLEPHTHFRAAFADESAELRFSDPRRFGSLQLCSTQELAELFPPEKLGPEPWELTDDWLAARLRSTQRCLKACLLDQSLFAGVGNIYADESLFEARLPPDLCGRDLDPRAVRRLRLAVVKVLERAIDRHGSTILSFYYGSGERGAYQKEFRVYQRGGEPCRCCRTPIAQGQLAGRTTHWCPQCQARKRYRPKQ